VDEAIHLGIDENGLGPRLGPLVVTAVAARTSGDGHARATSRPRGALRKRLDDSKKLVAYGDSALGEAWARAIARRMGFAQLEDPDALVRALSLDTAEALRTPCPPGHTGQCWDASGESFTCDPKLLAQVERDLDRLERLGVNVVRATCVVTCARRLNDGVERGLTRFHLDLHAMERLALDARERTGRDLVAICGKVGGFDRYSAAFGPIGGRLHAIAEEGRARSEYSVPGLGRIAFVRDADARHMLVSMASLVGKWVRDVLMSRIVRYHRRSDPELPDASGYHDPVTTRFIEATRLARRKQELPDDCFERRALYYAQEEGAAGAAARAVTSATKRASGSSRRA
jgi:ribonuclease HII